MIRKRIARTDDEVIYQLICTELIPLSYLGYHEQNHSFTAIHRRLNLNTTYVYIAVHSRIGGFISVQKRGTLLFIDMLAVDRQLHGYGLGKSLMSIAERYARNVGCVQSQLYVDDRNEKGILFYRRLSYHILHHISHLHCFLLHKSL